MKQIVIIEDEIIVAKSIKKTLQHHGFNVLGIATSYESGKQLLISENPDLILCDIHLNGEKSGIDLIRELYIHTNAGIIFISAFSGLETEHLT